MTDLRFTNPVSIFMGLGFPRDVENVLEAYDVLLEWNGTRDEDHAVAIACCRDAIARVRPAAQARDAFEHFAHNKGILTEDALDRAALTVAQEWGRLSA